MPKTATCLSTGARAFLVLRKIGIVWRGVLGKCARCMHRRAKSDGTSGKTAVNILGTWINKFTPAMVVSLSLLGKRMRERSLRIASCTLASRTTFLSDTEIRVHVRVVEQRPLVDIKCIFVSRVTNI